MTRPGVTGGRRGAGARRWRPGRALTGGPAPPTGCLDPPATTGTGSFCCLRVSAERHETSFQRQGRPWAPAGHSGGVCVCLRPGPLTLSCPVAS
jgi:hypothetical protein